jgi:hypothetical protein
MAIDSAQEGRGELAVIIKHMTGAGRHAVILVTSHRKV